MAEGFFIYKTLIAKPMVRETSAIGRGEKGGEEGLKGAGIYI